MRTLIVLLVFALQSETRSIRRWNKNLIKWKLTDPFVLLKPKQFIGVRNTVRDAFNEWAMGLEGLVTFEEVDDEREDIQILFAKRNHSCYERFDGRGGVVAHSMYPPFGVLHLDGDEEWKTGNDSKRKEAIDLKQVLVHEIGHTLGLRHSLQKLSVMRKHYEKSNEYTKLSKYDIRAIRKLYGE